jgi:hypothetical protein
MRSVPIAPMTDLSDKQAYCIAAAGGTILWVATTAVSGRGEAWDSPLYWSAAYPLGIAIAGVLGYVATDRPWRWGLALMLAQAVTLAIMRFSFGLLPLGLILFGVLAAPPAGAAAAAASLRLRFGKR